MLVSCVVLQYFCHFSVRNSKVNKKNICIESNGSFVCWLFVKSCQTLFKKAVNITSGISSQHNLENFKPMKYSTTRLKLVRNF